MSRSSRAAEPAAAAALPRRRYDSPVRRQQIAETRERIVAAGSDLVHTYSSWDWRELTFRAVAEQAGVSERTVYRHFPTEHLLHDAVMNRLEQEIGIRYEDVDLTNLADVTARIFASLPSFAVPPVAPAPDDPTFVTVDARRRRALVRAVTASTAEWSETDRETVAALLDVLWYPPTYQRIVGVWHLSPDDATRAITWLMGLVVGAMHDGRGPRERPSPRRRRAH